MTSSHAFVSKVLLLLRGLNTSVFRARVRILNTSCKRSFISQGKMSVNKDKNVICLFDVDGTLTKPRNKISPETEAILDQVSQKVFIGVVSGSDWPKLVEQFGNVQALNKFDYIFPENGVVAYKNGNLVSKESIVKYMGEDKLQRLINFSLNYMSKLTLPVKRGNFIEFRDSVINICPVGRSCSQQEREEFNKYDQEHKIREKFVETLEKEFNGSGLQFSIGGQISFDVFPTGWDKRFSLNHVVQDGFKKIHFFGDRTDKGGNDHEIFNDPRTIGHTVTGPEQTNELLVKLFLSED